MTLPSRGNHQSDFGVNTSGLSPCMHALHRHYVLRFTLRWDHVVQTGFGEIPLLAGRSLELARVPGLYWGHTGTAIAGDSMEAHVCLTRSQGFLAGPQFDTTQGRRPPSLPGQLQSLLPSLQLPLSPLHSTLHSAPRGGFYK